MQFTLLVIVVVGLALPTPACWLIFAGKDSTHGVRRGCDTKRLASDGAAAEPNLDNSSGISKFATLQVGDELGGTVTKVLKRVPLPGIYVDVGVGKDGFIEAGEVRDGFPIHGLGKFMKGTEITGLRVLRVSEGNLGLTLRSGSLERRPKIKLPKNNKKKDVEAFENVPQDEWLTGIVNGIGTLGVFVVLQPHKTGQQVLAFLDRSEFVGSFEDEVISGGTVRVRISSLNVPKCSISLTMKEAGDSTSTDDGARKRDRATQQQAKGGRRYSPAASRLLGALLSS